MTSGQEMEYRNENSDLVGEDAIKAMAASVHYLANEVAAMRVEIEASKTFIEKIQGEIGPVLESLQNNSMFKMLFKGK